MNETLTALSIQCRGGFDGGLRQRFHVEVYEAESSKLVLNTSREIPEFSITGLESSISYDILVYAVNAKGRSSTMEFTKFALRKSKEQMDSSFFRCNYNILSYYVVSARPILRAPLWWLRVRCARQILTHQPRTYQIPIKNLFSSRIH